MRLRDDTKTVKRLYDSVRWRKIRKMQLLKHPLCEMCKQQGKIISATVCDHIIPHHNDLNLFYDSNNLQSLCATCHGVKRIKENKRLYPGCDINGIPLDKDHVWNKK